MIWARGAFASHGETWAAALALRLAMASAVEEQIGERALLLLDDPYSALDPGRRDRIAERLAARGGQVVITVADDADVPPRAAAVWDVRAGAVTPRGRCRMPHSKGFARRADDRRTDPVSIGEVVDGLLARGACSRVGCRSRH